MRWWRGEAGICSSDLGSWILDLGLWALGRPAGRRSLPFCSRERWSGRVAFALLESFQLLEPGSELLEFLAKLEDADAVSGAFGFSEFPFHAFDLALFSGKVLVLARRRGCRGLL